LSRLDADVRASGAIHVRVSTDGSGSCPSILVPSRADDVVWSVAGAIRSWGAVAAWVGAGWAVSKFCICLAADSGSTCLARSLGLIHTGLVAPVPYPAIDPVGPLVPGLQPNLDGPDAESLSPEVHPNRVCVGAGLNPEAPLDGVWGGTPVAGAGAAAESVAVVRGVEGRHP
jgi:hypothetical protein